MMYTCELIPLSDVLGNIKLNDGVDVILGRNHLTSIKSRFCPRNQVSISADFKSMNATVTGLSAFASYVDGIELNKGKSCIACHGSIIELLKDRLHYKLVFERSLQNVPGTSTECPVKLMDVDVKNSESSESAGPGCQICIWEHTACSEVLIAITPDFDNSRDKVASFDLDKTLITTISGRSFPVDTNDWKLLDACIKKKLYELNENGYKIVVFSNQASLSQPKGKLMLPQFKKKIENIISILEIPVSFYISTMDGYYRKPSPGMWHLMCQNDPSSAISMNKSFYVGDAAGRPKNWALGKPADFATSDRLFALNIGIKFYTPEEMFFKQSAVPYTNFQLQPLDENVLIPDLKLDSGNQEVIIMVGAPASGKSHFVKHHIVRAGYVCVSRDNLGSWQKCVLSAKAFLRDKRSVVVDNTNPDIESRGRYMALCNDNKIHVRCFIMNTDLYRCLHNNKFRQILDPSHEIIAQPIIKNYFKHYQEPTVAEGFSEILHIPFKPNFENENSKKVYNYYLLPK